MMTNQSYLKSRECYYNWIVFLAHIRLWAIKQQYKLVKKQDLSTSSVLRCIALQKVIMEHRRLLNKAKLERDIIRFVLNSGISNGTG